MKAFSLFHSLPYHWKYIKHLTKINSVLNYFYLRSGKMRKNVFINVNFVGKNNLVRNLFWLNLLCILNDMAMNERIKKDSSIFYYQILNESENKKTLKNPVFFKALYKLQKSLKLLYKKVFEKIFFWIFKIRKKQEKLMIFQMNIHPAMSDYYKK